MFSRQHRRRILSLTAIIILVWFVVFGVVFGKARLQNRSSSAEWAQLCKMVSQDGRQDCLRDAQAESSELSRQSGAKAARMATKVAAASFVFSLLVYGFFWTTTSPIWRRNRRAKR
jgi:hypothetical protein